MDFIKFSDNHKIVNLNSVSNIGYVEEEYKSKVIFNLDYGVSLRDKNSKEQEKIISDYIYWASSDYKMYLEMKQFIKNKTADWIKCPFDDNSRVINPKKISSIVYDVDQSTRRYKIIFNLSHTVSMRNSAGTTSEYVFFKFDTFEKYLDCKKYVEGVLGLF